MREAEDAFRSAVKLNAKNGSAWNGLGVVQRDLKQDRESIVSFKNALAAGGVPPESVLHNLGGAYTELKDSDSAIAAYEEALKHQPDCIVALSHLVAELQKNCEWDRLQPASTKLRNFVASGVLEHDRHIVPPFIFVVLCQATSAAEQYRCARNWFTQRLASVAKEEGKLRRSTSTSRSQRLTVGYLSADFRNHPTVELIAEVLASHNRDEFRIVCYSYGPNDGSPMRQRIEQSVELFRDLEALDTLSAAQVIADDQVDVLIDLTGYIQHSRTEILAYRPALVQMNYLGFPGTTGADFIDYILVDDFIVPLAQQSYFTEKLIHLHGSYQCNDSQRKISAAPVTRRDYGLPENAFVFCSFNNCYKITPELFDVWMRLLRNVPESVLWLLVGTETAMNNLRREAELRGVAASRIIFAPRRPLAEHLARHRLADLFVDNFPCNAHTTASESLWAGLPVLTLSGSTFVSRVAGSLLRALGLDELITYNFEDYEAKATQLALNRAELSRLKHKLNQALVETDLFDGKQFARKLERAYRYAHQARLAGVLPHPFRVDTAECRPLSTS